MFANCSVCVCCAEVYYIYIYVVDREYKRTIMISNTDILYVCRILVDLIYSLNRRGS